MRRVADPETSTELARYEAQKLAFAPLVFQAMRAMKGLGALDVLYAAGAEGVTAGELVAKARLSAYASSLLLEASYAAGITELVEGRFIITKMGVFWLKDPLTRVNAEFVHQICYRGAFHLQEALRSGLPAGLKELGPWPTVYEGLRSLDEEARSAWFAFDHFYSDDVFEACLPIVFEKSPKLIVDIGANTGKFSRLCLERSGDVTVALVDLPGQLAVAEETLRAYAPRARFHPTNLLDESADVPGGGDVYWLSQFLDCFSEKEIVSILRRAHGAMPKGARLFILETFWDTQRHEAARFCVIATSLYFAAIANGNSKMYHSEEMVRCIRESGFEIVSMRHDIGLSHSLVECRIS